MVYLITGKAGAGKTTYAENLAGELLSQGKPVVVLDSEKERERLGHYDYSDDGRRVHLLGLALEAARHEIRGMVVIVAAVCPYKDLRDTMRLFWRKSLLVYMPGGELWPGTTYEIPDEEELGWRELPQPRSNRYSTTAH